MKQYTEAERTALIEKCKAAIKSLSPIQGAAEQLGLSCFEIALEALTSEPIDWQKRAESAEAKLAELDKQEPYAYAYRFKGKQGLSFRKLDIDKCDSRIMPLFTRSAPAINLAELVPSRKSAEDYVDDKFSNRDLAAIWNSCVSEMLRNIEEQSQ